MAAFPGENGKVAYSDCNETDCGIYVAAPDGSDAVQLTHNTEFCVVPRFGTQRLSDGGAQWSPDGRRIVFIRFTGGCAFRETLMVMNADRTEQQLDPRGGNHQPVAVVVCGRQQDRGRKQPRRCERVS